MASYGAYGTLFKQGSTTIGQVRSVSGPSLSKETIDVTHLSSTSRYREFISSLRDGGEITIEYLFDPALASHELIEDAYNADTATTYSVVFSDAAPTTWSFSAICTGIEPAAALGDALVASATFKLTGVPTLD